MRDFIFSSVRTRLILLFLLVLTLIALLFGFNVREQRNRALEKATDDAEFIFNLAVLSEQKVLLETKEILSNIAESPDILQHSDCDDYLAALLKSYPRYLNFGVIRPDGELICSALPRKGAVNLADRGYFRRALEDRSFSTGIYQVGRVTGRSSVNYGYPILDAKRNIAGVVFAAMDPSNVTEFVAQTVGKEPDGSAYVKIDSRGTVLAEFLDSRLFQVGQPVGKSIFEKISGGETGSFRSVGPDGEERLFLFSTLWGELREEDSYLLLGIPMEALLSESDKVLRRDLVFLALLSLGAGLLLWIAGHRLIVQPVNRIVGAAERISSGDLFARAALPREGGELGHLGLVFDEMAEELQKKAENLMRIRSRLAHILSASPAVIYARDIPPGKEGGTGYPLSFVSEKVLDLFGYAPGEVQKDPSWPAGKTHPDDLPAAGGLTAELLRKESSSREYRIRTKDGEYRWVLDQAVLVMDKEGTPIEIVGCLTDITKRKKAEEALERLVMAVEQAAEAFVITDADWRVEYVNPAFVRITGYGDAEATGKDLRILGSEKIDAVYREISNTIVRGGIWNGTTTNRKKDGTPYEEEVSVSPVRDISGKIVKYVFAKRDVSREVALQNQVQTAQRLEAVGTLAGGIAHDFNNALTGIFGFTEMAMTQAAGNEELLANLKEIRRCADRSATLTRQLLAYSRRQILTPVNLNLNKVVTDLLKLLSKVVGEPIRIRTAFDENLPSVHADSGQIEQVLMNLVLNARDAMPSGGDLLIETSVACLDEEYRFLHPYMTVGRFVVLSVSDNGFGMDEATRARVFDPFFTTKGPDKGTGLGLAMVYGIVKQHKGFIHLYSEPGTGTTFRIYLPAVDAPPGAKAVPRPAETLRGTETILLAEDDESVRKLVRQTLEGLGYTVLAAGDGREAVTLFEGNRDAVSLAILDVVMPGMGGKDAYKVLEAIRPGLKVIFMSGYTENSVHESFVILPELPFLHKPFTPNVLARKVREVLDAEK